MAKNEEEIKNTRADYQELVPSMGPRTVMMLEAGCSSKEYYQALVEQLALIRQNEKYSY